MPIFLSSETHCKPDHSAGLAGPIKSRSDSCNKLFLLLLLLFDPFFLLSTYLSLHCPFSRTFCYRKASSRHLHFFLSFPLCVVAKIFSFHCFSQIQKRTRPAVSERIHGWKTSILSSSFFTPTYACICLGMIFSFRLSFHSLYMHIRKFIHTLFCPTAIPPPLSLSLELYTLLVTSLISSLFIHCLDFHRLLPSPSPLSLATPTPHEYNMCITH